MNELYFCHQTGEPLTSDIQWFRCLQCRQYFKIEFRFEEKPICKNCATRSGMDLMLNYHRDHAHSLIDSVFGATTKKIDDWLSTKMESIIQSAVVDLLLPLQSIPDNLDTIIEGKMEQAITEALNISETTSKYQQQQTSLQQQIDELQSRLSEAGQWRQRAENAELQLRAHDQRKLTEQEVMELEGYRDNGDGTVTQLGTGLTWLRFSLGQQWIAGKIIGNAEKMSIQETHGHIKTLNSRKWLGRSSWKLPKQSSLQSLVKRSFNPTINQTIFPETVPECYWAAGIKTTVDYDSYDNRLESTDYYYVDFSNGRGSYHSDNNHGYVRLVAEDG